MNRVLMLGAAVALAAALMVWRSQHDAEVWHTVADSPY